MPGCGCGRAKEGDRVSLGSELLSALAVRGVGRTPEVISRSSDDIGSKIGINGYASFTLFGFRFWITSTHIALLIIVIAVTVLAIIANRVIRRSDPYKKPGIVMTIIESVVDFIDKTTYSNMGEKHGGAFRNYIGTLLLFIFFSNISGVFGLRPPTADYGVTFGLAMITFFIIHYNGFKYQKMGHITGLFDPIPLTPINIIGEISTPISMSLRLFGNVLCGTVIMGLLYNLLPQFLLLFWPGALHIYFDLFSGAIQAYVFTMLTMVFVSKNFDE
ncbi:MAG: F0F1 ATP synthase subunit A [Lachnospiraceae bacterium]|nr:F0F1 ATP synthase subunit A [Lachnospiraceae bacterium]